MARDGLSPGRGTPLVQAAQLPPLGGARRVGAGEVAQHAVPVVAAEQQRSRLARLPVTPPMIISSVRRALTLSQPTAPGR